MQQVGANLEDEDTPRRVQMNLESALEKTERQVAVLCRAFGSVAQYAGDSKSMEGMDVPVELREKAVDTCIQTLHQLDNVLNDMARWSLEPSVVEKNYARLLATAGDLQEAQAMHARISTLPSSRLPVHLHEYAPGQWGAYLLQNGAAVLLGRGRSIQEALNDFDVKALKGEVEKKTRRARKKPAKKLDGPKSDQSAGPA